MKKFIDLQLFGEDASTAGETAQDNAAKEAAATKEAPAAKYTDEDLDRIIGQKKAEWKKAEQKKVDEAAKLAKMDAQQKAEYERDQLQKELEAFRRKDALAEMTKVARKMLSDAGISVSDDVLSVLVSTDAEQTKAAVDGFSAAFNNMLEAAVKERLRGEAPRRGQGGAAPMTKEQIMAIADTDLRQKKMLENRHLFNI